MADFGELVAALRSWTRNHDPHVRAAVELLITHGHWLRREDFTSECVRQVGGVTVIDWNHAAGPWYASSSEVAMLDLAVAIGSDRYRLSRMDDENAGAIVKAFAAALAVGARRG